MVHQSSGLLKLSNLQSYKVVIVEKQFLYSNYKGKNLNKHNLQIQSSTKMNLHHWLLH